MMFSLNMNYNHCLEIMPLGDLFFSNLFLSTFRNIVKICSCFSLKKNEYDLRKD